MRTFLCALMMFSVFGCGSGEVFELKKAEGNVREWEKQQKNADQVLDKFAKDKVLVKSKFKATGVTNKEGFEQNSTAQALVKEYMELMRLISLGQKKRDMRQTAIENLSSQIRRYKRLVDVPKTGADTKDLEVIKRETAEAEREIEKIEKVEVLPPTLDEVLKELGIAVEAKDQGIGASPDGSKDRGSKDQQKNDEPELQPDTKPEIVTLSNLNSNPSRYNQKYVELQNVTIVSVYESDVQFRMTVKSENLTVLGDKIHTDGINVVVAKKNKANYDISKLRTFEGKQVKLLASVRVGSRGNWHAAVREIIPAK